MPQDNLESQTYETFEKDATKYACYQAAVAAALRDRVPEDQVDSVVTTLMVVGAGKASEVSDTRALPVGDWLLLTHVTEARRAVEDKFS